MLAPSRIVRALMGASQVLIAALALHAVFAAAPARADTVGGTGDYSFVVKTCTATNSGTPNLAYLTLQSEGKAHRRVLDNPGVDRETGGTDTYYLSWPSEIGPIDKLESIKLEIAGNNAWCISELALLWDENALWAYKAIDAPATGRVDALPHPQSGSITLSTDGSEAPSPFVRFTDKTVSVDKAAPTGWPSGTLNWYVSISLCSTTDAATTDPVTIDLVHDGLIDRFAVSGASGMTVNLPQAWYVRRLDQIKVTKSGGDRLCIGNVALWHIPTSGLNRRWWFDDGPDLLTSGTLTYLPNFAVIQATSANSETRFNGLPLRYGKDTSTPNPGWKPYVLACIADNQPLVDACGGGNVDCDGALDENFVSTLVSCPGRGACYREVWSDCNHDTGQIVAACPTVNGTTETCNGIDDNCDGSDDAQAFSAVAETCDNQDNNCNGLVDDVAWTPITCGVGVCLSQGFRYCAAGATVNECYQDYSRIQADNDQDGIDDDCDGQVDEEYTCIPDTCASVGAQCGTLTDGCGGTLNCGNCEGYASNSGVTCGGDGRPYICAPSSALPDPATVAPLVVPGAPFLDSVKFLYEGSPAYQSGVQPGAIRQDAAAAVRGHVYLPGHIPLDGIEVSVQDHPEYGVTFTRNDGTFDLVVNGGGAVVLNFKNENYIPVQRAVALSWGFYGTVDDVVMIGRRQSATPQTINASDGVAELARGDVVIANDHDSTPNDTTVTTMPRQLAAMFPAGTLVSVTSDASTIDKSTSLQVHFREFTVGTEGREAMPGDLPPSSQYTFAFEAIVEGAKPTDDVQFKTVTTEGAIVPLAIPVYVHNFLGFPVGSGVPAGYYDRSAGRWMPMDDGRVIRILSITNNVANVDVDGDGDADAIDDGTLVPGERGLLASYAAGTELWRFRTSHFTAFDLNFPGNNNGTPLGKPDAPPMPNPGETRPTSNTAACGSILHCESRLLGEQISLPGTGLDLVYNSGRVAANTRESRTIELQLDPSLAPAQEGLPEADRGVDVSVSLLGREFVLFIHANDLGPTGKYRNGKYVFEWDGLDAMGRKFAGAVKAQYTVAWRRANPYIVSSYAGGVSFGSPASASCVAGTACCSGGGVSTGPAGVRRMRYDRTKGNVTEFVTHEIILRNYSDEQLGLGGWSIAQHHTLDTTSGRVSDGTGAELTVGEPRAQAVATPAAQDIVAGPDGGIYYIEAVGTVVNGAQAQRLMVYLDGNTLVVDDALPSTSPAETRLSVGLDGRIYASVPTTSDSNGRRDIYVYTPKHPIASRTWARRVLRLQYERAIGRDSAASVTATADGTIFINVRDQLTGINDERRYLGKLRPVPEANGNTKVDPVWLSSTEVRQVIARPNQRIWVFVMNSSTNLHLHLHEVQQNGRAEALNTCTASGTTACANANQSLASQSFCKDTRFSTAFDGSIWLSMPILTGGQCNYDPEPLRAGRLWALRVGQDRAVKYQRVEAGDDVATLRAGKLTVTPDGVPWVLRDAYNTPTLNYAKDLVRVGIRSAYEVVSKDGAQVYEFDRGGIHLRTRDALTGVIQLDFDHDDYGRLRTIRNMITGAETRFIRTVADQVTIEAWDPTLSKVIGTSTIKLDANAYAKELSLPLKETTPPGVEYATYRFEHDKGGLLRKLWTPRAVSQPDKFSSFTYEAVPSFVGSSRPPRFLLSTDRDPTGSTQTLKSDVAAIQLGVAEEKGTWCDGTFYIRSWKIMTGRPIVHRTTQEGRKTSYESMRVSPSGKEIAGPGPGADPLPSDSARVFKIEPSGYWTMRDDPTTARATSFAWPSNKLNQSTIADREQGGSIVTTWANDPRLGETAPYATQSNLTVNAVGANPKLSHKVTTKREYFDTSAFDSRAFTKLIQTTQWFLDASTTPNVAVRTQTSVYDRSTPNSTVITQQGSANRKVTTTLDLKGRPVSVQSAGQVATQLVYGDRTGGEIATGPYLVRVTRTKGSQKREQRLRYNANGYLEQAQVMDGASAAITTTFAPDLAGFPRSSTTSGATTAVTPDVQYGITGVTPPGKSQHTSIVDLRGLTSRYSAPGYPSSTQTCPIGSECMQYSADRDLKTVTLGDGTVISNTYAPSTGLLTTISVKPTTGPATQTFNYSYELGRLKTANITGTAANNATTITDTITYQSDLPIDVSTAGTWLVGSTSVPVASKVSYVYNDFVELKTVSAGPSATANIASATYDRDADGLLSSVTFGGTSPLTSNLITFNLSSYTGKARSTLLGNVKTRHDFDDTAPDTNTTGAASPEGAVSTPGFGDLTALNATLNNVNVSSQSYTYDNLGRIKTLSTSVLGEPSVVYTYNYDAFGRLASVLRGGTTVSTYTYDANGNRTLAKTTIPTIVPTLGGLFANAATQDTSTTSTTNKIECTDTGAGNRDELCLYGGYRHKFNMLGQMIERTRGTFSSKFTYDAASHLTKVEIPGSPTVNYINDASGRRIAKLSGTTVVARWAYMSDLRPVLQTRSDGSQAFFVYGNKVNVPEAMLWRQNTSSPWKTYRLITDHLGSVRLVVDAACASSNNTIALINANSCVAQRTDYDEYGNITKMTGDPNFQPFGFAGGLHDRDTGLVRFGARDYDPWSGRWTSRDPIKFAGGQGNLYAYVDGEPVGRIDPSGLVAPAALVIALGLAVGTGTLLGYASTPESPTTVGAKAWGAFVGGATGAGAVLFAAFAAPAGLGAVVAGAVGGGGTNFGAQVIRSAYTGDPVNGLEVIFSGIGGGVGGWLGALFGRVVPGTGLASDFAREAASFCTGDAPVRAAQIIAEDAAK